jgi:hypothetical protein
VGEEDKGVRGSYGKLGEEKRIREIWLILSKDSPAFGLGRNLLHGKSTLTPDVSSYAD